MNGQLTRLFDEYWEFKLLENPLMASVYYGDHRYDDRLPAVGEGDYQRRREALQDFLVRLQAFDPATLSTAEATNRAVCLWQLENELGELQFRTYLLPVSRQINFYDVFLELPDALFTQIEDYQHYCTRLQGFKQYVEGHIKLMRIGLHDGFIPPKAMLAGVEDSLRAYIVTDASASRFWAPFTRIPATIAEADRSRIVEEGRAAILSSVVPAFEALLAYVHDEYLPRAREDVAAASLPNGEAFYQFRIRSHTTLDLMPQQIHQIGLEEVARIRAEMDAVIAKVGFSGSFAEFLTFLRTDPRFYVTTPGALLREVAYVLKKIDGELPALFRTLPRTPYGIKPVPDAQAPGFTTGYYTPLAGDGARAGFYLVNTYDLPSRPLYEIESLSLHEAVPGHHLQVALQAEMADLPAFRRFVVLTAYEEGWGLYAERLGLEIGCYRDPYSDFGRLTYEMWRACRLVVDTGMHALGWTRRRAIDYMAANTALTHLNIVNEIDRYIAWPGQALGYKIGELKIRELRARAEARLGSKFDVRAFHDVVLRSGEVPLTMLEANVSGWLATQ